jgi:hypothetical protein
MAWELRQELTSKTLRTILVGLLLAVLGGVAVSLTDRFVFVPSKYPDGNWNLPRSLPAPITDVQFSAADGTKLHAWYGRPAGARTTILLLHGNAGNLTHRVHLLAALLSRVPSPSHEPGRPARSRQGLLQAREQRRDLPLQVPGQPSCTVAALQQPRRHGPGGLGLRRVGQKRLGQRKEAAQGGRIVPERGPPNRAPPQARRFSG